MVTSKKHSSAKDKPARVSAKDKVFTPRVSGVSLVGSRIKVWWPLDRQFYEGVVESYDSIRKKHQVLYDDGEIEKLDMKKERWELVEDDDAQADEISLEDESDDNESSDGSPEPLSRKKGKSNGKLSVKGRADEGMPRKRQKTDFSAKSKLKAKSGKKSEESEGDEKETPNLETERNDEMGDIGGKIIAAASRISGRFKSKVNGQGKEIPIFLKSCKKISESNNRNKKRSSSSSEAVSKKVKKPPSKKIKSNNTDEDDDDDNNDMSDADESDKPKQKRRSSSSETVSEKVKKSRTSSRKIKSNNTDEDEDDKSDADVESNKPKPERTSSSSQAVSVKVKKPRTSLKKSKTSDTDDDDDVSDAEDKVSESDDEDKVSESDGEDKVSEADDKSDDDSKPLVSLLKKSPEVMEALKKKLKGKKDKEEAGEGSSGNEGDAVEEA